MSYEVVVVGGGIGGLTTAALLAARGVNVCLVERQSSVGGCVAAVEKFGYSFENGFGLYALWDEGEIHDRIFAELPVKPPEVKKLAPILNVRLPDQPEIVVTSDSQSFFENLRTAFPECAAEAVSFFSQAEAIGNDVLKAPDRLLNPPPATFAAKLRGFFPKQLTAEKLRRLANELTSQHLDKVSFRFQRFLDAQLQMFAQASASECSYLYFCILAAIRARGLFGIRGGASAIAETLASSIKKSGGAIRLNAHALRLAYDSSGKVVGVHLLTGETISASRAVVSNLTVWDTYGKLVGLDRTPSAVRLRLKELNSWGVYQLFLGIDEAVAEKIPSDHIIGLTDLQENQVFDPTTALVGFSMAPAWDRRAPDGKRAAMVQVPVDVTDWFTYHVDESEHEEQDQRSLETLWARLLSIIPELSGSPELIETATPRTWYEDTRRKLGMLGGLPVTPSIFGANTITHDTDFENFFMVGDTVYPGAGLASVSHGALTLADQLTGKQHR
ncbi:MAG TPA: NAD(P)/FAD-dependent oxidoreductase [Pyrinomonadaceae bacterium]|nr:NAD(P)/FAD-dependent oxidoreductase [Pyrinomonadaceae bacterium]